MKFIEFETKYKIDCSKVFDFKQLIENMPEVKEFVYCEGPDWYFTKADGSFLRYRRAETDKGGRSELTLKQKPEGASNNIKRKEVNLRVDKNNFETIQEAATMLGFAFNFQIVKQCHIYNFKDATLVFYTVYDSNKNRQSFVEIELNEQLIPTLTEDECWDIIKKYEVKLEPLGITYKNRLTKSLYEMYVRK
jgi:adenylate cyclase class IV